ncbi:BRR6 (YGL247W) [Zygosaccharomyces parabailii]|nr:BRR6 (YGL247W) [Zygosaccharomyces parabailii]CDH11809.1 uncharacterized protein ZBAI_03595 [Zygosaccharomyces bailii ISA1307]
MVQALPGPQIRSRATNIAEYVQLVFNTSILVIVLSILIKFILLIKGDVDRKVHWKVAEEIVRVKRCQKNYEQNGCSTHVPALEKLCDGWHHCMQSRGEIQSASLWTQTLAETLNAFVEPISFRSLMFVLLAVCALVLVTNIVIASYRVQYYFHGDGRTSYHGSSNARIE